jgi:KipI family sensor histidine kinase inhibitor
MMAEVDDVEQAATLASTLRSLSPPGVVDIVPAARTVLVDCATTEARQRMEQLVPTIDLDHHGPAASRLVEVPTVYDGEDLDAVAAATDHTVDEVIELHSGTEYRAAFCGFAPGFVYLTGLTPELHLPRRKTPRARVQAGSVAMGADLTGVYPTSSPGGWHLLGSARVTMWDPARPRPALIEPGDRVRFVRVET